MTIIISKLLRKEDYVKRFFLRNFDLKNLFKYLFISLERMLTGFTWNVNWRIGKMLFSTMRFNIYVLTGVSGVLQTYGIQLPVSLSLFTVLYTPERLTNPFNALKIFADDSPLWHKFQLCHLKFSLCLWF